MTGTGPNASIVMGIDHVTAIVSDADAAAAALKRLFGASPVATEELAGMRIRSFRVGDFELHVNEPTGPGPVADYHRKNGPGYHHVALRVADLDEALKELSTRGFAAAGTPVQTTPGLREVFLDPSTTGNLLIQLVERADLSSSYELDPDAVSRLAAQSSDRDD
jgi:methylmalonyl-CoA/ethylmalonyl-CoA epimerase